MNIALLHVPALGLNSNGEIVTSRIKHPSMGLFFLANVLTQDHNVEIIHLGHEIEKNGPDAIHDLLESQKWDFVGFSIQWFYQIYASSLIAGEIKKRYPSVFILAGGLTASIFAEPLLSRVNSFDAVLEGHAALSIKLLAGQLANGNRHPMVPNLWHRHPNGLKKSASVHYELSKAPFHEMHQGCVPIVRDCRNFVERSKVESKFPLAYNKIFFICTGAGCNNNCTFCGGSRYVQKSHMHIDCPMHRRIEYVIDDIKHVVTNGFNRIYICFDPLPESLYYNELFENIAVNDISVAATFGAWHLPSESLLQALASYTKEPILELSPEVENDSLRSIIKGKRISFTNDQLFQTLHKAVDLGIRCEIYFSFFHPGDTVDTITRRVSFCRTLQDEFGSNVKTQLLPLSPDPLCTYQTTPSYDMICRLKSFDDYFTYSEQMYFQPELTVDRGMNIPRPLSPKLINICINRANEWNSIS